MALLETLLLPPTLNALLTLVGGLLWRRHHLLGGLAVVLGLGGLLVLATPVASHALRQDLEPPALQASGDLHGAEAIVILGGGRDYDAPEFGWGDAPSNASWRRLAYGTYLHRQTDLPILVSGGRRHDEPSAEAGLMAAALEEVFEVPVRWYEGRSRTTAENARYSAELLDEEGIRRVALVSQAWHLPRARAAFERAGLEVVAAPTEFASAPPEGLAAWRPSAYHLHQSSRALHEWLGRAARRLKDRLPR
ncbi:YdcF family protein [Halomonas sp. M4R1S46]|uniref:YdcF family protein n=1 Tax=Halomonas sp. M4R1S46 TaxID=2982692 RepID=UPI0021E48B88|nr:YdcF family protein [Halomonas sp. M4R1S46]UYG09289.1 YdcF family protein [Halomonas sp. M4R1S46]